jgi:hypothetical protein
MIDFIFISDDFDPGYWGVMSSDHLRWPMASDEECVEGALEVLS